ncbi:anhydro-N-acetylmuramic acid kinase [Massilia sp. PWRC2]|uniref:anhydro-N-acetylmuramic acid kinase n=1 Tax=Massilia sp. PWRC2 TaxID=2804626 RepID=UPI003CF7D397
MNSPLFIGMMSGTSLDGVDAVLARFAADGAITTLATASLPFDPALRAELMALQAAGSNELEREAIAANGVAALYADCVAALGVGASDVRAIGAHGQTLRHRPELGFTWQSINGARLAELAGIDVICDFRSRDVAAGGHGAPLVPAYHAAVFGKPGINRVLVNIGGVANISVLHADGAVSGFDTGPGNVLMDGWIGRHHGHPYDADGAWAASGNVDQPLLAALLAEPYFSLAPPKSTGRDLFHLDWLDGVLAGAVTGAVTGMVAGASAPQPLAAADVQATLTQLTATSIAGAIAQACPGPIEAVYVCGGGASNGALMAALQAALQAAVGQATVVASTAALGVAPQQVEALAFAWLAYRFDQRKAGNLPAVTGASGSRILGALYPA